ncbi:ornithine cyclodeaminase family protein [Arthrobacter yangruifuii]|uniref:Ornithine cyclodeaminase family protein n=1 Tax=Arthrobacter yangruifuii TaxID=2606616 RepID=A0A5N6MDV9_9MICC|nr:ornithine cyclodeaminase family protein [Arthrobacter yangruifuii]KAD3455952.1 ornithine cyclodeaminase family protein [Arthrobacter yangruifuii]
MNEVDAKGERTRTVFIDGEEIRAVLSPAGALEALEETLRAGFDPEQDAPRTRVDTTTGQFLQMPSAWNGAVGTKLLTITPGNANLGAPVIQGLYALFGGPVKAPLAVLDGIELTNLRTSAVSALGARLLLGARGQDHADAPAADGGLHLVLFGTGVQAWQHILTFHNVFTLGRVTVVGRNPTAAARLAAQARSKLGLPTSVGDASAVVGADLVVCCTAARQPLFDGALVPDSGVVIAIGSHSQTSRELDDTLMARAAVIVESRDSALREAGEVVQALKSGAISGPEELHTLAEVVSGGWGRQTGRPAVFKTTGMPWEDLAVARAVVAARLSIPANGLNPGC